MDIQARAIRMTKEVPSSAQIQLAQALAYQTGKRLPRGYTVNKEICTEFLDKNQVFIKPTDRQVGFACFLAQLLKLKISKNEFLDYVFCKRFLSCFAGVSSDLMRGVRRARIVDDYMREDKDLQHLQFKLDMSEEDVRFMCEIISTYGHGCGLVRWDDMSSACEDKFPEFGDNEAVAISEETEVVSSDAQITLEQLLDLPDEQKVEYLILSPEDQM